MRVRPHGLSVILSSHLYIMIMQASLPLAPLHSPLLLTNSATASFLLLQGAPCSPQFLLYVRNFLSLVDPFLHFLRPPLLSGSCYPPVDEWLIAQNPVISLLWVFQQACKLAHPYLQLTWIWMDPDLYYSGIVGHSKSQSTQLKMKVKVSSQMNPLYNCQSREKEFNIGPENKYVRRRDWRKSFLFQSKVGLN